MGALGTDVLGTGSPSNGNFSYGMVLHFPASPTTGQTFAGGGAFWIYNGTYWESTTYSADEVEFVGSRETDMVLSAGAGNTKIVMDTIVSDPCLIWNTSSQRFEITSPAGAGIYVFSARAGKTGGGACSISWTNPPDASKYISPQSTLTLSSSTERHIAFTAYMGVGDHFYYYVYDSGGVGSTLAYLAVCATLIKPDRDL